MHVRTRALAALSVSAAALVSALALPTGASAATGSYTIENWRQFNATHGRLWQDAPYVSPPAGIPADAKVTTVTAHQGYQTPPPSGMDYEGRLCDYNQWTCVPFGSARTATWTATSSAYAGKPAATWRFFIGNRVNDWRTGSILTQLPAPEYPATNRWVTVNYEYTPAEPEPDPQG